MDEKYQFFGTKFVKKSAPALKFAENAVLDAGSAKFFAKCEAVWQNEEKIYHPDTKNQLVKLCDFVPLW